MIIDHEDFTIFEGGVVIFHWAYCMYMKYCSDFYSYGLNTRRDNFKQQRENGNFKNDLLTFQSCIRPRNILDLIIIIAVIMNIVKDKFTIYLGIKIIIIKVVIIIILLYGRG